MKWIIALLLASASPIVWAGGTVTGVNNGGDDLRYRFIAEGKRVIRFLEDQRPGISIAQKYGLNINKLDATLQIERISVRDFQLRDNTGSVVDALGFPGIIVLNKKRWENYFERRHNITYLVFHEMLRSADINDDGYVISRMIDDFFTEILPGRVEGIDLSANESELFRFSLALMFKIPIHGNFKARAISCTDTGIYYGCRLLREWPVTTPDEAYSKEILPKLFHQFLARYVRPHQRDGEMALTWSAYEVSCKGTFACRFYAAPFPDLELLPPGY